MTDLEPMPIFTTLRSTISTAKLMRLGRDGASEQVVEKVVERALGELVATLDDLLGLGFSVDEIEAGLVWASDVLRLDTTGGGLSVADRLLAFRLLASRVERRGLRLYGRRWSDRVFPRDLRGIWSGC
jgi:hypothetical protein